MGKLIVIGLGLVLVGCASNPLLTGKPQHWQGRSAAELKAGLGEPTRIISRIDGTEVWEYMSGSDFVGSEAENTLTAGGVGGAGVFGASPAVNQVSQQQRLSRFEEIWRFRIREGKVKGWHASRVVDGRVVWEDY